MSRTVQTVTIDLLRSLGITTIFGNPGSTELPMFRSFPSDFRYVLGLQESVVLAMADGYAQATRNAALVNLHSAAGTGHALGNLFTAYKNQTPLVVTAGQQARSIMPMDPYLFAERATEFPQPYVKWTCEPACAENVPAAIARAYHIAMTPPCGPTFVSIPVDDWDRPCEPFEVRRVQSHLPGHPEQLRSVGERLASAKRPTLVLGAGVSRDEAWDEAIALAERHQADVWVAPFAARNPFPEDHPLFCGFLSPMREKIVAALQPNDFILTIGGPLSLYHVEGYGPHIPDGATAFLITDNPAVASWAPNGNAIIANCRLAIQQLLEGPVSAPATKMEPRRAITPLAPPSDGLTDTYLLQQIAALRPRNSIVVEEAPSSRAPMHDRLPILDRDGFYTCASGGLGHGMAAAVGVALGRPNEHVIAIIGDGSAMYSIQSLWSAAQLGLPMTFVIINNGRYEALIDFGHQFGLESTPGTRLSGIDFVGLARSQGVDAVLVEDVETLDKVLATAFAAPRTMLIEVRVL